MEKLLNLDIYKSTNEALKRYIDDAIKNSVAEVIVTKETLFQFPVIGDEKSLYIDTTANKVYRWNNEDLKYYIVGSDYEDISVIDCNF